MNLPDSDLQDMYRRAVLEHSRHPHNFLRPTQTNREATGFNPLCGDKLSVYLCLDGEMLKQAAFEGSACAICMASASIMTDALSGQPVSRAQTMTTEVQNMFSNGMALNDPLLREMEALESVRNYPSRVKCALLAWTTVAAALNGELSQVSTEN